MKKKIICLLLSLSLILTLLSGCSKTNNTPSNNTSSKKYELTFWTFFAGGDGDVMTEIVNSFNKSHPNIHVKEVPLEWGDPYYTKLISAVASGNGPDIAVSHITMLPKLVNEGVVQPIDDYTSSIKVNWNNFSPEILKSTIFDSKHYSIPIDTHPFVLFYNTKLLKDAGMLNSDGKPAIQPGPDGFIKFLTDLKSKLPKGVAPLSLPTSGDDPYRFWWALYSQLGAHDVVSNDLKSANIDMDKAVEAATFLRDLFQKYKVIPLNLADFAKTFQNQQAAIFTSGVWNVNVFKKAQGLNFDIMPFPQIYNNASTWADSHNLILPVQKKVDKNRELAALTFMKYVADNGQIWAKAGHIPAELSVQQSEAFKSLPKRNEYVGAVKNVVFPKPTMQQWAIKDAMMKGLDTIWNGSKQPRDVFNSLEKQINDLLKQ